MSELGDGSVSLRIEGRPRTAAPLSTVAGARPDGGQVVIRRQVMEGFGDYAPYRAEDAGIEILCRQEGDASLLSVVKNIVDGLDQHEAISSDRSLWYVVAAFDPSTVETIVSVTCEDERYRIPPSWKYSTPLVMLESDTVAAPIGTRPLVAASGQAVERDADAYIHELLAQWDELASHLDEATVTAIRALPSAGPYRLTVEVNSKKTADLDNVVARVVHLLHVAAYCDENRDTQFLWHRQPAIEDLVTEINAYRSDPLPVGLTVTLTPVEKTDKPLIDKRILQLTRPSELPLPQRELASDSPRLGRKKKRRGPR